MDTTTYFQEVAASVRSLMEERGESILSLSEKSHIPYTTLWRRTTGDHPFTIKDLAAIAPILETTPDKLLPKIGTAASAA